jgi:hypothetical protein
VASGTLIQTHYKANIKTAHIHDFYSRIFFSEGIFKNRNFFKKTLLLRGIRISRLATIRTLYNDWL